MYIDFEPMTTFRSDRVKDNMATAVKAAPKRRREKAARADKQAILDLLPDQGYWTDEQYLWLTDHTQRYVEFTDGRIEVLAMPTPAHQGILMYLVLAFHGYIVPRGGKMLFSPLRLRIRDGKYREPDLLVLQSAADERQTDRIWEGADLVLEVVSEDSRKRDLVDKRKDYAEGRVPEYWIVDPETETITVLRLKSKKYAEHGIFRRGANATSALLKDFSVRVDAVLDAK